MTERERDIIPREWLRCEIRLLAALQPTWYDWFFTRLRAMEKDIGAEEAGITRLIGIE